MVSTRSAGVPCDNRWRATHRHKPTPCCSRPEPPRHCGRWRLPTPLFPPRPATGLPLPCAPQPFSRESASALSVNQADQIQFTRHCRQLFRNSLPSQKESPVVHGSLPPLPGSLCNDKSSSAQQLSEDRACLIDTVSQNGPQSTNNVLPGPPWPPPSP